MLLKFWDIAQNLEVFGCMSCVDITEEGAIIKKYLFPNCMCL
jgi:hypothetical protein